MKEIAKAAGMYVLTSAIAALAARYHLTGEQTSAIMADCVAAASAAGGVALHYIAYQKEPGK